MARSNVTILDRLYDVAPLGDGDIKYRVQDIPEGWVQTHSVGPLHRRAYYICRRFDSEGRQLVLLGANAASECVARFGVSPLWVGQCTYAVYARFKD